MFGTSASQPFVAATCRAARQNAVEPRRPTRWTPRRSGPRPRGRDRDRTRARIDVFAGPTRGRRFRARGRVLVAAEASSGAANEGPRGIIVRTGAGPGRAARRRPEALALSGRRPGGRLARTRTYFRGNGGQRGSGTGGTARTSGPDASEMTTAAARDRSSDCANRGGGRFAREPASMRTSKVLRCGADRLHVWGESRWIAKTPTAAARGSSEPRTGGARRRPLRGPAGPQEGRRRFLRLPSDAGGPPGQPPRAPRRK